MATGTSDSDGILLNFPSMGSSHPSISGKTKFQIPDNVTGKAKRQRKRKRRVCTHEEREEFRVLKTLSASSVNIPRIDNGNIEPVDRGFVDQPVTMKSPEHPPERTVKKAKLSQRIQGRMARNDRRTEKRIADELYKPNMFVPAYSQYESPESSNPEVGDLEEGKRYDIRNFL